MSGTALIVDSVSTNRIICKAKLTAAFYRVFQAETGRATLEIIAKKNLADSTRHRNRVFETKE